MSKRIKGFLKTYPRMKLGTVSAVAGEIFYITGIGIQALVEHTDIPAVMQEMADDAHTTLTGFTVGSVVVIGFMGFVAGVAGWEMYRRVSRRDDNNYREMPDVDSAPQRYAEGSSEVSSGTVVNGQPEDFDNGDPSAPTFF